jgi:hypothetical protein
MAFKQPCFIRKNTPELRKKLEELGYEANSYECFWDDENRYIITTIGSNGFAFYTLCIKNCCILENKEFIDCGDNEELFIAIASLRDDSDINQWFVMDVEEYMNINQGDWFIATDRTKGKHIGTQIDPMYCHKATVEEIIEHFKKE